LPWRCYLQQPPESVGGVRVEEEVLVGVANIGALFITTFKQGGSSPPAPVSVVDQHY
jgi:hypothetical protein